MISEIVVDGTSKLAAATEFAVLKETCRVTSDIIASIAETA